MGNPEQATLPDGHPYPGYVRIPGVELVHLGKQHLSLDNMPVES